MEYDRDSRPRGSHPTDARARNSREDFPIEHRNTHRGYEDAPRSYSNNDSYQNHHYREEDWKCLECGTWNDVVSRECRRCRSYASRGSQKEEEQGWDGRTDRYHSSAPEWEDRRSTKDRSVELSTNNEEFDEFGRIKAKRPKKTRWPPCFEMHGSSFVLDTRSGMFYESVSDFFYDPKSQLYYGNKQGAYFRYDSTTQSFEAVSSTSDSAGLETAVAGEESSSATTKKASISIHLKTKSLSSDATTTKKPKKDKTKDKVVAQGIDTTAAVVVPKQHAVDMEKWSERQLEKKSEVKSKTVIPTTANVPTTAKGEPICLVCRRRFANLEKLRNHEAASALHKENLAKQQKEASNTSVSAEVVAPSAAAVSTYIDRAEQRRQMHLTDADIVRLSNHPSMAPASIESVVPDPKSNLDASNIGHQMLQKLGWKSGDGLGRGTTTDTVMPSIQQDWDRIESTVAAPRRDIPLKKGIGR